MLNYATQGVVEPCWIVGSRARKWGRGREWSVSSLRGREEGVGSPEWRLNPRDYGDWPRGTHEEWSAIIGALASWSFRPKGVITQRPNTLVPNQFSQNAEDGRPQEEERNRWDRIFSTGLMSREFSMSSTLFKPTPLILDCAVAWHFLTARRGEGRIPPRFRARSLRTIDDLERA